MSSQFKSEKDRFYLNSDNSQDAGAAGEHSFDRSRDKGRDAASPDDTRSDRPPGEDRESAPMSEETRARYAELLSALEQAITRAVEHPEQDTPQDLSEAAKSDAFESDATSQQAEAPHPVRLPTASSPFAPSNFRSFVSERPLSEARPFEPMPRRLFAERQPPLDDDEERAREETLTGLRLHTRPRPPAAWPPQPKASKRGASGLLRRTALGGVAIGAVIVVGALYLSNAAQVPNTASAFATSGDRQPVGQVVRRMVVTDLSGPQNRPMALGVTVESAPHGASVVVKGMPAGSKVTAGVEAGAGAWRIPVRDMARATVLAPRDYVGTMYLPIDLRLADDTIADSNVLRLEWTAAAAEGVVPKPVKTTVIAGTANALPAPPAPASPPAPAAVAAVATDASGAMAALAPRSNVPPVKQQETRSDPRPPTHHLNSDEIANLLERGQGFLQSGDIAAARLFLRRAADSGHAQAAMALAATYDPIALKEFGVLGITPNVETARFWYEKASQLGSAEAIRRLQRLAQQ
jgi:hypothetical protein